MSAEGVTAEARSLAYALSRRLPPSYRVVASPDIATLCDRIRTWDTSGYFVDFMVVPESDTSLKIVDEYARKVQYALTHADS